eukprot:gb/GEZN01001924.1/.p1 GENE.gb/GEZN01001924.1/~~gb/GEZN01001924.1/.p1  ORF type:complete len:906 (+),score=84.52 gb/GEZN01001924.1/:386-2719(+)
MSVIFFPEENAFSVRFIRDGAFGVLVFYALVVVPVALLTKAGLAVAIIFGISIATYLMFIVVFLWFSDLARVGQAQTGSSASLALVESKSSWTRWREGVNKLPSVFPHTFFVCAAIATTVLLGWGCILVYEANQSLHTEDVQYNMTLEQAVFQIQEENRVAFADARVDLDKITGKYRWDVFGAFLCIAPVVYSDVSQPVNVTLWVTCEIFGTVCIPENACIKQWKAVQYPDTTATVIASPRGRRKRNHNVRELLLAQQVNLTVGEYEEYLIWKEVVPPEAAESSKNRGLLLIAIGSLIYPSTALLVLLLSSCSRVPYVRGGITLILLILAFSVGLPLMIVFLSGYSLFVLLVKVSTVVQFRRKVVEMSIARDALPDISFALAFHEFVNLFSAPLVLSSVAWKYSEHQELILYLNLLAVLSNMVGAGLAISATARQDTRFYKVALETSLDEARIRCSWRNVWGLISLLLEFLQCLTIAPFLASVTRTATANTSGDSRMIIEVTLALTTLFTWVNETWDAYFVQLYWICFAAIITYMLTWYLLVSTKTEERFSCFFTVCEPLFAGFFFMPLVKVFLSIIPCVFNASNRLLEVQPLPGIYCYLGWHYLYVAASTTALQTYVPFVCMNMNVVMDSKKKHLDVRDRTAYTVFTNIVKVLLLICQVFSSINTVFAGFQFHTACLGVLAAMTFSMAPSPFVSINFFRTLGFAWNFWMARSSAIWPAGNELIIAIIGGNALILVLMLLLLIFKRGAFKLRDEYVTLEQMDSFNMRRQVLLDPLDV